MDNTNTITKSAFTKYVTVLVSMPYKAFSKTSQASTHNGTTYSKAICTVRALAVIQELVYSFTFMPYSLPVLDLADSR